MWKKFIILTVIVSFAFMAFACAKKEVKRVSPAPAPPVSKVEPTPAPKPVDEFEASLTKVGPYWESSMLKDIHFDFDKYNIRPGDALILQENAKVLKAHPNVNIQIEGHCDERGTIEYNLALGERRANSAKNYLVSLGISPSRITTISYGEERPVDPRHCEEAWAKNRRCHFIITSK
ncbi:MAG: peptidoglycan-associated lipoprotein Pal [Deltaproteobacteria bacterium]|nr:peptidoglycan-associated lipoprotein Pal [Deltaproteobacteria bacterium]